MHCRLVWCLYINIAGILTEFKLPQNALNTHFNETEDHASRDKIRCLLINDEAQLSSSYTNMRWFGQINYTWKGSLVALFSSYGSPYGWLSEVRLVYARFRNDLPWDGSLSARWVDPSSYAVSVLCWLKLPAYLELIAIIQKVML